MRTESKLLHIKRPPARLRSTAGGLLSLSLLLAACNPGQSVPGHNVPAPAVRVAPVLANVNQAPQLTLRIQGDPGLQQFGLLQAKGICLKELKALKFVITLPQVLEPAAQSQLQKQGFSVSGKTLSRVLTVHNVDELIQGYDVHLPNTLKGRIDVSTQLLNPGGQLLGSVHYQAEVTEDNRLVTVVLRSLNQRETSNGCPMLTTDISGATLQSLSGGLMFAIQPPGLAQAALVNSVVSSSTPGNTNSQSQHTTNVLTRFDILPPSGLQIVARSAGNLTLAWSPASTEPMTYSVYLNGEKVSENQANTHYTFRNLQPNTEYALEVRSLVGNSQSAHSSLLIAWTTSMQNGATPDALSSLPPIHMSNWQQGSPVKVINNISNGSGEVSSSMVYALPVSSVAGFAVGDQIQLSYGGQAYTLIITAIQSNALVFEYNLPGPVPEGTVVSKVGSASVSTTVSAQGNSSISPTPAPTASPMPISTPVPTPTPIPTLPPGDFAVSALQMGFVNIPAGTFQMGSPNGVGNSNEYPQQTVHLSAFQMQVTEVTLKQWWDVMGFWPYASHRTYEYELSITNTSDRHPVYNISWCDIVGSEPDNNCTNQDSFLKRLNQQYPGQYRLPTEAEWEYAARAATSTSYACGEYSANFCPHNMAWFNENASSSNWSMPVATKQPNSWGLYDMHGNASEWVHDWWSVYTAEEKTNPTGPSSPGSPAHRVIRGGTWQHSAIDVRSASRTYTNARPDMGGNSVGFRLVRNP